MTCTAFKRQDFLCREKILKLLLRRKQTPQVSIRSALRKYCFYPASRKGWEKAERTIEKNHNNIKTKEKSSDFTCIRGIKCQKATPLLLAQGTNVLMKWSFLLLVLVGLWKEGFPQPEGLIVADGGWEGGSRTRAVPFQRQLRSWIMRSKTLLVRIQVKVLISKENLTNEGSVQRASFSCQISFPGIEP